MRKRAALFQSFLCRTFKKLCQISLPSSHYRKNIFKLKGIPCSDHLCIWDKFRRHLTIVPENMRYLRIKNMQDVFTKTTGNCWEENKKTYINDKMCLWIGKLNIFKMPFNSKWFCRFQTIPSVIPQEPFRNYQVHCKIYIEMTEKG